MYELKASVGKNKTNNFEDVVFIQFALRHLKKVHYHGSIDGKYSNDVQSAIDQLEQYSLNGLHEGPNSSLLISSSGGLIKKIPQKYHGYKFHIFKTGGRIKIFLEAKNAIVSSSEKHEFPLQKAEAKELLLIQKRLLSRFGVLAKIVKMTVGADGKIHVDMDITGGRFLNLQTLAIEEKKQDKPGQQILDFLFKGSTSPLTSDQSVWTAYDTKSNILSTVRVNKNLVVSRRLKRWILKSLGLKVSSFTAGRDVVETAFAAYEAARINNTLSASQEEKLVAYFGADKKAILENVVARQLVCRRRYLELDSLQKKVNWAFSGVVIAAIEIEAVLKEIGGVLWEKVWAFINFVISAGGGAAVSGFSKGLGTTDKASKLAGGLADVGVTAAQNASKTPGDSMGAMGWVGLGIGSAGTAAGIIAAIFAAGSAAVAVGVLLTVIGAGIALVDSILDIWDKERDLKDQLFRARLGMIGAKNKVENRQEELKEHLQIMDEEGCFSSPADYYFLEGDPKDEIRSSLPAFYKRISAN